MEEIKQIGNNIKRLRLKKGFTQLDLSAACGFEETTLYRLEHGKTNPTVKTLLKIANALQVKLTDIVRLK
ncbi:MAG: helix-turn-helix transcriptional regulator [Bacteroidetes bacterium]|nr:helix-turn-helix transcriptional regulator [Bacteroidota bacterium]